MVSKDVLMAIKNEERIEVLEALARVIGTRIELLRCLEEITVYKKSNNTLITRIFQDNEGIKQITSDDYMVEIKLKDPHVCEFSN